MSEQPFPGNYAKMNREQLLEAAARFGIEEPESIPTIKELRELVVAYAANGAVEIGLDNTPGADAPAGINADAQDGLAEGASSETHLGPDIDGGDGTAEPTEHDLQDAIVVPDGCLVVIGVGPVDRCAFFERHRDHPNGEVFVLGEQLAAAFPTPALMRAIGKTLAIVEV